MDLREYSLLSFEELTDRIVQAKRDKNAVLLVHNYQRMEVQKVADFLGDSLGLAEEATRTEADIIVFCGVDFMAQTAKILNPEKKVLMPDLRADCPMAKMIDARSLGEMRRKHPQAVVVSYVNTTAEVKALSDICCTSSNAVKVVQSLKDQQILFTPDRNLAEYCRTRTGADIIPWEGYCYVHDDFRAEQVVEARKAHSEALFIAHPECRPEVLALADHITSTSGMVHYVEEHREEIRSRGIIIGTEVGLVEQLQDRFRDLTIFPLSSHAICATMKLTTLAKVAWCLETESNEIQLDEDIRERASRAVQRMMEIT